MSTLLCILQALKIQPQTIKGSYIKLIALMFSLFFSVIRICTVGVVVPSTQVRDTFISEFAIHGVGYLTAVIAYILIRDVRKDCKCLKVVWLVDIAYLIAGLFYYVGINLPMTEAQPILLGMAVVLYRFIPFVISKYYQSNLAKEHQTTEAKLQLVPEWILAAESMTLFVEFDAWYTVIANSLHQNFNLNHLTSIVIESFVLWALFVLIYMFILYYTVNIQYCGKCNVNTSCVVSNLGAIVLIVAFGVHLLAGNNLLIGYFGGYIGLIIFKVYVLIVVFTVLVLLLKYRFMSKTQQDKLLPRALYQHLHPDYQPLESITDGEEELPSP